LLQLHDDVKQDIRDLVQTRPENLIHDLVTRRIGYEIANIVNEATFKVSTFLSEKIVEELLVALHSTQSSLVSCAVVLFYKNVPSNDVNAA
jgi:CARMIL C-terminus